MKYFVSAIGTDSGKSLVCAILVEALKADYWKPVQAGQPTDTGFLQSLVSRDFTAFPERYNLATPASPHYAAEVDKVDIRLSDFELPKTDNPLIVEGAGGLLVPINQEDFMVDMAMHLETPIILVANLYLGSINHTLLSLEALKARNAPVKGIIFNGPENASSEQIIEKHCPYPVLYKVRQLDEVNKDSIKAEAKKLWAAWEKLG